MRKAPFILCFLILFLGFTNVVFAERIPVEVMQGTAYRENGVLYHTFDPRNITNSPVTFTPGSWTLIARNYDEGFGGDRIMILVSDEPDLIVTNSHVSSIGPWFYEVLSINGIPWQIFNTPGQYIKNVDKNAIGYEWYTLSNLVHYAMKDDPDGAYTSFCEDLPALGKKMVSIYQDRLIGAYYTSTTVEAKPLPAKPFVYGYNLETNPNYQPEYFKRTPDPSGKKHMIPLRGTVDYLGANITWEQETQSIVIKTTDKEIVLKPGQKNILVNGKDVVLDIAPIVINGVTFVPLPLISEQMGYTVKWFGDKQNADVPRADIYN